MKKIVPITLALFIIFLTACSNTQTISTKSVSSDSPDYIKESFTYYQSMILVIEALKSKKNIKIAYEKFFENDLEAMQWVIKTENAMEAEGSMVTEEERQVVVYHIKIMQQKLSMMYQFETSKPEWNMETYIKDVNGLGMSINLLEEIYKSYGYKPN